MSGSKRFFEADFYERSAKVVARALLGQILVRVLPTGERISGRIVETEAYLGADDPGAHTYNGRKTERVRSMYLGGGHAYVYFIYGVHYCINVVTGVPGSGQAVLLRALEPLEGLEIMRSNRKTQKDKNLTNGPGKLCQALWIDRKLDGQTFYGPELFIERGTAVAKRSEVAMCARIGLGCKHEAAGWPLRYLIAGNPYVSVPAPPP